jgi:hypothetical protein
MDKDKTRCNKRDRIDGSKRCNGELLLNRNRMMWQCLRKRYVNDPRLPCKCYVSIYEGSLFENMNSQLGVAKVLLIARHLLEGYTVQQSVNEVNVCRRTVWLWRRKIKNMLGAARLLEVCFVYIIKSLYKLIILFAP